MPHCSFLVHTRDIANQHPVVHKHKPSCFFTQKWSPIRHHCQRLPRIIFNHQLLAASCIPKTQGYMHHCQKSKVELTCSENSSQRKCIRARVNPAVLKHKTSCHKCLTWLYPKPSKNQHTASCSPYTQGNMPHCFILAQQPSLPTQKWSSIRYQC